jgi:hypothetical protein
MAARILIHCNPTYRQQRISSHCHRPRKVSSRRSFSRHYLLPTLPLGSCTQIPFLVQAPLKMHLSLWQQHFNKEFRLYPIPWLPFLCHANQPTNLLMPPVSRPLLQKLKQLNPIFRHLQHRHFPFPHIAHSTNLYMQLPCLNPELLLAVLASLKHLP